MIKHHILNLNRPPSTTGTDALRDPITASAQNCKLIVETIAAEPGTYLVSVNIEVKVLEEVLYSN